VRSTSPRRKLSQWKLIDSTLTLPAGALREAKTTLDYSTRENDDIVLREIISIRAGGNRMANDARSASDWQQRDVPAESLYQSSGALALLIAMTNFGFAERQRDAAARWAVRPGVVYTGDGRARHGLRAGSYTVYASRGSMSSVARSASPRGRDVKRCRCLSQRSPTPGLSVAHALQPSRTASRYATRGANADAGRRRIEFPIATESQPAHQTREPARRMNVRRFSRQSRHEVTTPAGHFNIFRRAERRRMIPHHGLRGSTQRCVQRQVCAWYPDHPRNVHSISAFGPRTSTLLLARTTRPEFTFDAMEV